MCPNGMEEFCLLGTNQILEAFDAKIIILIFERDNFFPGIIGHAKTKCVRRYA
jgi:hypothetical protein